MRNKLLFAIFLMCVVGCSILPKGERGSLCDPLRKSSESPSVEVVRNCIDSGVTVALFFFKDTMKGDFISDIEHHFTSALDKRNPVVLKIQNHTPKSSKIWEEFNRTQKDIVVIFSEGKRKYSADKLSGTDIEIMQVLDESLGN